MAKRRALPSEGTWPAVIVAVAMMVASPAAAAEGGANVRAATFGARGDGISDDGPAIASAIRSLDAAGGSVELDCGRSYRVSGRLDLSLTPGVVVEGCLPRADDPISFSGYRGNLASLGGIVRDPSATIVVGRDSGLRNVLIRQAGLAIPAHDASAFAGTAITTPGGGAGQAALLENVLVIGAATCLDDSAGGDRLHIDGLYCDGTNGEILGPSFDTSTVTNVHNWPFATSGADPKLRSGVGLTVRGASDDTVFGAIFDFGHRTGFLFDSDGNGKFHVEHLWADGSSDTCVRIAGGRGINISSLTAYTCGVAIDVDKGAEVQITQAFLVSMAHECVKIDGTLSFALLHLENCRGGGIKIVTTRSVLALGFLQILNLAGPWVIGTPAGFTSDHIGIAKFFTDAPAGSSLYEGQGPQDPVLAAASSLALPPNADAVRLGGRGVVLNLVGGWGGRTVTVTTASRTAAIAPGGNVLLTNGVAFGGRADAVISLRYDAATQRWRETARSAP